MLNKNKTNNSKNVDKRNTSLKLFSIGSVAVILAIVIVLNVLLFLTLDDKLKFDLSANDKNEITDVSEEYINSMPEDMRIRIVGLFERPSTYTQIYEYIIPLLDDMASKSNGRITVEYIDPKVRPSIISELDPNGYSQLQESLYAIKYDDKISVIDPFNDCFSYDMDVYRQTGQYLATANKVESAFINTILNLTTESNYKAYFLTGNQEETHDYLENILDSMNVAFANLPVSDNFVVPSDCDLLIISCPKVDISENVQEAIKAYIDQQDHPTNILVSVNVSSENTTTDYSHLNNVLDKVGLSVTDKCIIENDPNYIISSESGQYIGALVDNYSDLNPAGLVTYRTCRQIVATSNPNTNVASEPVIISSPNVGLVSFKQIDEEGNYLTEDASYASVAMHGFYQGTVSPVDVYVIGTSLLTSDEYLSSVSSSDYNAQTIRALIARIVSPENQVEVPVNTLLDYSLDISKINANVLTVVSVVFIALVPFLCIAVATIVYYKRKHL